MIPAGSRGLMRVWAVDGDAFGVPQAEAALAEVEA
jgi:hypothetical protein